MYCSFDKEKPLLNRLRFLKNKIFELPTIDEIDIIGLKRKLIDYRSDFYPFEVMIYGF